MMRMHHIREQNASLMAKRERPSTSNMPSQWIRNVQARHFSTKNTVF
jgi:hypothetical protein